MIFLTYDFVWFALTFLGVYSLTRWPQARLLLLIAAGVWFQAFYGGVASLSIVLILSAISYAAARTENKTVIGIAIAACVVTLLYCKYMLFLASNLLAPFFTRKHRRHRILVTFGYPTRYQLFYVRVRALFG